MPSPFLLLMPSYNQAHFLSEAIQSCLDQDDPLWELWILDNSSDASPEILRSFTDPRIHAIHRPVRMDVGTCLNELLGRAKGDHFSFIHTDNRLLPGYVRKHRAALSRHPQALAYCDFFEIDDGGKRRKMHRRPDPFPLPQLFSSDSLGVPFAATTALADRIGGFTTDDLADDVYFVLRADGLSPRVHISEPLMEYRVHGQSRTELSGGMEVRRAIHRSALKAYRERSAELPDPFAGLLGRVRAHVAKASAMALSVAAALLKTVGAREVWIEGTGPASFWLAWACADLGRAPKGFLDAVPGRMLGLEVHGLDAELIKSAVLLRPRKRKLTHRSLGPGLMQPFRWLMAGLSPEDTVLRRMPPELASGLLIPYQASGKGDVWIRGKGPMAAYLGYLAEMLGGENIVGWVSDTQMPLGGLPTVQNAPSDAVEWVMQA